MFIFKTLVLSQTRGFAW